jgi:DNA-binding NarL/FixJ family response regulator
MQIIVLVMQRGLAAQGLMRKLRDDPAFQLVFVPSYSSAAETIRSRNAGIALIEVAETAEHDVARCLALCAQLRRQAPLCKLLLMCPEQDEAAVTRTVKAKREGHIDDFVFYDASAEFLVFKLLSMEGGVSSA